MTVTKKTAYCVAGHSVVSFHSKRLWLRRVLTYLCLCAPCMCISLVLVYGIAYKLLGEFKTNATIGKCVKKSKTMKANNNNDSCNRSALVRSDRRLYERRSPKILVQIAFVNRSSRNSYSSSDCGPKSKRYTFILWGKAIFLAKIPRKQNTSTLLEKRIYLAKKSVKVQYLEKRVEQN